MPDIQKDMTPEQKMEFRKNNPMCTFCEHGYITRFRTWCNIADSSSKLCPKTCPNYKPTLEPIEKRSYV